MDLNHGPSGYEPDELPDCSTPRRLPNEYSALQLKLGDFSKILSRLFSQRACPFKSTAARPLRRAGCTCLAA